MEMLSTRQLVALVNANAIRNVAVQGTVGGFVVEIDGQPIESKRGHKRIFKKLQTAASFLKTNGIGQFNVDLSNWNPNQLSTH